MELEGVAASLMSPLDEARRTRNAQRGRRNPESRFLTHTILWTKGQRVGRSVEKTPLKKGKMLRYMS